MTVTDHPGHLGDLAEIFLRRRIVFAIDSKGHVVLLRPDSVQVDYQDASHRREVDNIVKSIAADNTDKALRELALRSGLLTVRLPADSKTINGEQRWPVTPVNEHLERFSAAGISAIPRHVFLGSQSHVPRLLGASASWAGEMAFPGQTTDKTPTGNKVLLTTAEPSVEPAFLREPVNIPRRVRPRVLILDTGLCTAGAQGTRPEHQALVRSQGGKRLNVHVHDPWLNDPNIDAFDDEDEPDDDGSGTLDFEAGHGTFVTGIVRQICPDAEVHVAGVLSSFGEGDSAMVLATIARIIDLCGGPFDIVLMSFGAYFAEDDATMFGEALKALLGDAVMIAAAGNQQTCRPYYPAGLADVIGVGALDAGGKAFFTNFGPWVDACAPAIDVVSTFFDDFVEVVDEKPRRHFNRWARWSGTSFAAPKVAALIAEEQYLYGGTAQDAWRRLTSYHHHRFPDLGIVFNV